MILNNFTNNQYSTPPISVARQLSNEATANSANTMPNIGQDLSKNLMFSENHLIMSIQILLGKYIVITKVRLMALLLKAL